jgi:hypothetical protein
VSDDPVTVGNVTYLAPTLAERAAAEREEREWEEKWVRGLIESRMKLRRQAQFGGEK